MLLAAVALAALLGTIPAFAASPAQDLASSLNAMARASGGTVGITLIDLGGPSPTFYNWNPNLRFTAASTYKLPVLMWNAQGIASGRLHDGDVLCYRSSDYEPGHYGDYWPGRCFRRADLAYRVAHWSDNTAAHILVRYMGGSGALNRYAAQHGARNSAFFYPNVTTALDLARLWQSEAYGQAGGSGAQSWLYPKLTHTAFESGIPAGVPRSVTVTHKIGILGWYLNDAGLVIGGPNGQYVLVVMTRGLGGARAWRFIARVSARVWQYENSRS